MLVKLLSRSWRSYIIVLAVLIAAAAVGWAPSRARLALLVVAAAGLALLWLLPDLRRGLLFLPAAALLIPLEISTGTAVDLNSAVVAVPALLVLWLASNLLTRNRIRWAISRLNRPLIVFLPVILLSWLLGNVMWDLAVPRPSSLLLIQMGQIAIYLFSFFCFWLTANLVVDLAWLRRIAYAFVVFGGGAVFVFFVLTGSLLQEALLPRGLPNLVGVWVVGLSLALALYDRKIEGGQRMLLFGVVGMVVIGGIIHQREYVAAWLPPLVAICVILWWHLPRAGRIVVFVLGLIILAIGLPALLGWSEFESEWEESGGSRLTMWQSIVELAIRRPIFGLGPAAYRYYHFVKPIAYGNALWLHPTLSAHNQVVDLFAQLGLFGVACYVWFLAEVILLAKSLYARSSGFARGYASAVAAGLAGMVTADMFAATSLPFIYNLGFRGFRASVLSWMLLGGLVALEQVRGDAKTEARMERRRSAIPGG